MSKKKQPMTIDHLARLMQDEFSNTRSEFATIRQMHQVFIDRFDNLDNQVSQLRLTTSSLVKMVADRDREMRGMDLRLRRVERRLGLLSN